MKTITITVSGPPKSGTFQIAAKIQAMMEIQLTKAGSDTRLRTVYPGFKPEYMRSDWVVKADVDEIVIKGIVDPKPQPIGESSDFPAEEKPKSLGKMSSEERLAHLIDFIGDGHTKAQLGEYLRQKSITLADMGIDY